MTTFDCFKCSGKGHIGAFSHVAGGACFQCGGTGKLSYRPRAKAEFKPKHPELVVPEAERATRKQWDLLLRLCGDSDDRPRRALYAAGAKMANELYVTRAVMSRAIDIAKQQRAA